MKKIFFIFFLIWTSLSVNAGVFDKKNAFLKADQAFVFTESLQNDRLSLNWDIASGYYLYKKSIEIIGENGQLIVPELPLAEIHQDDFFGEVEVYRHQLTFVLPFSQLSAVKQVEITYQGCTEGFCYPPETRVIALTTLERESGQISNSVLTKESVLSELPLAEQDRLAAKLIESKYAVFWFFLFGLGLAFTPCVLPMLPLLSAIVIGREQRPSTAKAFGLSVVYVQGMALTYTLLGLLVAAIGLPFQVALQSPYVLLTLSVIFVLLALSMFGLFTLQLPVSLQTKLTQYSQQQKSGVFGGVFVMGMIAGLVASPCTSAPLSGALLYVAQSGDLFTGAITLYLLALGMGLPLIFITVFGNNILPKSGNWMIQVKNAFGFVLLALPIFLISRVFPEIEMALWFSLAFAFSLWLLYQFRNNKGVWVFTFVVGVMGYFYYSYTMNRHTPAQQTTSLSQFERITSYVQLQQVLSKNPHSLAMLDLYADWCVACKEFETHTFSDVAVQKAFADVLLLQVDMTKNSEANRELMQKLHVIGLPTLIFFNQQGQEIEGSRITGFMQASPFVNWLQKMKSIQPISQ
ncbi:protein-disulfide reductase DsbD [Pasteurella multocida]|uniref:protein-disulfide reductase DsbD n=1 Tax=Pasteurella multocida TaxID=747 RepID=UPI00287852F3|nr:protein-disulfide reductase DsbD [Pasteurella multocida]MEB3477671.1 protein-disulfide reductase DsbD [Pasteurella multocida]MEB3491776.1 protein-disulfide reductase DsbD [Pasteurella multocida]HDR1130263.1 protein-disulfide reductase DsbD [Pasteurella multocida]HDR1432306.1 protein-disulfide reductase DsbD [Pasteurella multocida]HDR1791863.1 protein-disulfide reductase DsbD [Pasteurella multocida]